MSDSDLSISPSDLEDFDWDSLVLPDVNLPVVARALPRKRKRRDRSVAIPRLLKSDLRRQYGFMFANALNTADREMIGAFFDRFTASGLLLDKRHLCPERSFSFLIRGTKTVSQYWSLLPQVSPDYVFRVQEAKVLTRRGREDCRLVARFTVCGTQVQNLSPKDIAQRVLTSTEGCAERETVSHMVAPMQPVGYSFSGRFVLSIGEDRRIEKVDMEAQ